MASVTHQALLMRSAAYVPTAGWFQPLSVAPKIAPRATSTINSDGAWMAALAFAATGVKGLQWQQPLSIPVRTRRDLSGFNSDGAWLAAIRPVAVAGSVPWQQPLSVPIARSKIQAPSLIDPSSYAQGWIGVAARDPYLSNVVLLMGFNGADGSVGAPGWTDESPAANGTASTAFGGTISTAQSVFGGSSARWLGGGQRSVFSDSANWEFSNGLFTIEYRFRPVSTAFAFHVAHWSNTAGDLGWVTYADTAFKMNVSTNGTNNFNDIASAALFSVNTWYAACIDFDGTKYRAYIDGTMVASSVTLRTIFNSSQNLSLGAGALGSFSFNGYIDELRITKGVARYASDAGYTVATVPFSRS